MCVADKKARRIDQHLAVLFGLDLEAPNDRTGERFFNGSLLLLVTCCAIVVIRLDEQYLVPRTLEENDARRAELAAVKPKRV